MRRADPKECLIDDTRNVLMAKLPEREFLSLFPVKMDKFQYEPEPSIGALIQLDNSQYIGVCYGQVTNTLSIVKPVNNKTEQVIRNIMEEVGFLRRYIFWIDAYPYNSNEVV